MQQVGIRELRDRVSEILRTVREQQTEYVITHHGQPTALLVPINQVALQEYLRSEGQKASTSEVLTQKLYGFVKTVLSEQELDELYYDQ